MLDLNYLHKPKFHSECGQPSRVLSNCGLGAAHASHLQSRRLTKCSPHQNNKNYSYGWRPWKQADTHGAAERKTNYNNKCWYDNSNENDSIDNNTSNKCAYI